MGDFVIKTKLVVSIQFKALGFSVAFKGKIYGSTLVSSHINVTTRVPDENKSILQSRTIN